MLNSHEQDPCCGKAISEALRSGALYAADSWSCPECGMEWKPRNATYYYLDGNISPIPPENRIRHWSPHPIVAIVR